jgi:hypothetical protein
MLKRTRRTLWIVAAVVLVLAAAVYLRFKAPPEAARLLPESDGILYVNPGLIRTVTHILHVPIKPSEKDPEYQAFTDAIGFDAERDLNEAAVALHRIPDKSSPSYPVAYSLVLVGKLDGKRLAAWLEAHANSRESYAGRVIYSLSSQNRTVRVAQIGYDTVAVSNTPTPEQIHSILDRRRSAALPFSGSTLLAEHYSEMPLLSFAWGMGQILWPFSESGKVTILGLGLPIEPDTTFLASVHWAGALKLRVVEIAASDTTAATQADSLSALLGLARGATVGLADTPTNQGLKELLRTTHIRQNRNRVEADAILQQSLLMNLVNTPSEGSPASSPDSSTPVQTPEK